MSDEEIVELYWSRSPTAIDQTARQYGAYCHTIAYQILGCREDAEERVSDTWLAAWNTIPPHRPQILRTFLGKITRQLYRTRQQLQRYLAQEGLLQKEWNCWKLSPKLMKRMCCKQTGSEPQVSVHGGTDG